MHSFIARRSYDRSKSASRALLLLSSERPQQNHYPTANHSGSDIWLLVATVTVRQCWCGQLQAYISGQFQIPALHVQLLAVWMRLSLQSHRSDHATLWPLRFLPCRCTTSTLVSSSTSSKPRDALSAW
jgi:hypothetical protein